MKKEKLSKFAIAVALVLIIIGCFLFSLDIIGLFMPLRNPDIYKELHPFNEPNSVVLTEKQFYESIAWNGETPKEYVVKVNNAVHEGIAYYWYGDLAKKYNLFIPPTENWMIFAFWPGEYEFFNWHRAVARGVGFCSQQSLIEAAILREHGIDAYCIGLTRHTVVMAQVDKANNTWWVLGPTYNVVIEHSINEIAANPEIIRSYFVAKGYSEDTINFVISVYRDDPYTEYAKGFYLYLGNTFYVLKWFVPLMFIGVPTWVLCRNGKGSKQPSAKADGFVPNRRRKEIG